MKSGTLNHVSAILLLHPSCDCRIMFGESKDSVGSITGRGNPSISRVISG